MAIYELEASKISKLPAVKFKDVDLQERADLQRLLRDDVEVIAPDTMVLAEEFGSWDDSRRRIDLLALDRDANLVVIELKRTKDGGHMELQAIRYAGMVTGMTFAQAVDAHQNYRDERKIGGSAREAILDFLQWGEPVEDDFGSDVRIVLVSADFSKELTTAVPFLNDRDLDIRCVRMKPYLFDDRVLVDVQQVAP
jgi:ketosteroid isomerase-like protein